MEKEARASFRVIRLRRWPLLLALLGLLALAVLPVGRLLPVFGADDPRVEPGVTVLGRDVGGMTEIDLRAALAQVAVTVERQPISAQLLERVGAGPAVVPEVSGTRLDLEATVYRALNAPAGAAVVPATASVPAVRRASDFPTVPIYSANPAKQAIGLLINVAWGEKYLPAMLETLRASGARATFFLVGRWAEKNPDLVRRIKSAGHELANHGYDDRQDPFNLLQNGTLRGDIDRASKAITGIAGGKIAYYSPHKGQVNEKVARTASELGLRTIMWSLDTLDWQQKTAAGVTAAVTDKVKSGDLILMHPTEPTEKALPEIIRYVGKRNLSLLTLSELLDAPTPSNATGASPANGL